MQTSNKHPPVKLYFSFDLEILLLNKFQKMLSLKKQQLSHEFPQQHYTLEKKLGNHLYVQK